MIWKQHDTSVNSNHLLKLLVKQRSYPPGMEMRNQLPWENGLPSLVLITSIVVNWEKKMRGAWYWEAKDTDEEEET